ncbi:MAG: amidohydrolase [Cyanobacteria bacterium SZAS LIN-2]|nr:amidohydrolase [Cyanobacteria bacterium SZAS LIN-2]
MPSAQSLEPATTLALAQKFAERTVQLRRAIHEHPELSFHESKTAELVARTMTELGYRVKAGVGATGVTAEIGEAPFIGIRADMDALPIDEDPGNTCVSKVKGVMHACGHDAHTACGLGAAMILKEIFQDPAKKPKGGVRFLFQPAEEQTNADGKSGATLMMQDGAIEGLSGLFGLHVFPQVPVGVVGLRSGAMLAACDTFEIKIKGKGCHGGYPQEGVDAVVLASQVVQTIQTIVSRRKSALSPAVLTLGGIKSSTYRPNIVSDEVDICGTVRYFDPALSDMIKAELSRAVSIVEPLGGSFEMTYINENPALINDPAMVAIASKAADRVLGDKAVFEPTLQMGAEDFSFYCEKIKSCFIVLGVEMEGPSRAIHTPQFDIDERALPLGAAMLAECALLALEDLAK